MDINLYFTTSSGFFAEFFKNIIFSLVASYIFWFVVVYRPRIKRSKISKTSILERYKDTKIQIIDILLGEMGKNLLGVASKDQVFNYSFLKNHIISSDDIKELNKINNSELINIGKSIFYYLNQLKTVLLLELSQEYIVEHTKCKSAIMSLIFYIDQYSNNLQLDTDAYHKFFDKEIHELVLGMSTVIHHEAWPDLDNFPFCIEEAYSEILVSTKIKKIKNLISAA